MRFILILVSVSVMLTATAQNKAPEKKVGSGGGSQKKTDFTGNWQGIITQPRQGLDDNYAFLVNVVQTKDSVKGLSRIELNNSNNFGIIEFKGTVKGSSLIIQETKITDENIRHGAWWCIKSYTLTLNADKSLTGEWIAPKGCGPGKIFMYRTDIPFNKDKAHSNVYVSYDDLKTGLKEGKKMEGDKINMTGIKFDGRKINLTDETKVVLDELAAFLKTNKIVIKILAHTDDEGDDFPNFTLTIERAKAIVEYLKSKGIVAKRLQYEGFGEARPIRDNTSENGRAKNRRVEIEVVKQ